MEKVKKKFDYTIVIVVVSILMVMVCLGFCSSTNQLFLDVVPPYLNVTRTTYSITNSIRYISTSIVNLFFGVLIAKFGAKKLIMAGFISLSSAMLCFSLAESLFVFYIGGVLLGVGFAWTTTTMVGQIVNKWAKKNRGTIMGIILASNGVGGAIAVQIISPIITVSPTNYKNAYLLIAAIVFATGIIVSIFIKNQPKDYVEEKAVPKKKVRGEAWVGVDFNFAKKSAYFYGALVCIFFTGLCLQSIENVAKAHMADVGIDPTSIANILSFGLLILTFFKFITGFMYDKCGLRFTATTCSTCSVIAIFLLTLLTNSKIGLILATIYSVIRCVAIPLETIMLPIYANDLFGDKANSKILGIFVSVNTLGYAVGTPLVNICYDLLGSYVPAFYICAGIMTCVIIALQFIITKANKIKKQVLFNESLNND